MCATETPAMALRKIFWCRKARKLSMNQTQVCRLADLFFHHHTGTITLTHLNRQAQSYTKIEGSKIVNKLKALMSYLRDIMSIALCSIVVHDTVQLVSSNGGLLLTRDL